jgi:hypothetical protein
MKPKGLHLIKESDNFTGYSKSSWLREAKHHLRSALLLRSIRRRRSSKIKHETAARKRQDHIQAMEACVLSSNLLVGYAVELALKAGLTAVYARCSGELFERDVRRRYGHDYVRIAREIEFPLNAGTRARLRELRRIVLEDGRYPPFANTQKGSIREFNRRSQLLWSDAGFKGRVSLCKAIIEHVKHIDADSNNPVTWTSYRIDEDGYAAFRRGGNLRPRITVKYSSAQRNVGQDNRRALRRLLKDNMRLPWKGAKFRCVEH